MLICANFVGSYNRWHQSTNWGTIEIIIKINLEKGLQLNSWTFFEKVVPVVVKEFHGISWSKNYMKKLTPGRYRVPTFVQTKKTRSIPVSKLIVFAIFWVWNGGNNANVKLIFWGLMKSCRRIILTAAPFVLNTKVDPFDFVSSLIDL